MSQNTNDEIEHLDFTDYYADIKKGGSESGKKSERLDTNESENMPEPNKDSPSSDKKRCQECEKCDLDPKMCNHDSAK